MREALGPIEYLVVEFPGNQFTGEIIPALTQLVGTGLIRIIDLAVISKDAYGNITILESGELPSDAAAPLLQVEDHVDDLMSENDLLMAAEELHNNCTAAAMLFENVWAVQFLRAVRNANGQVLANVRVPHDVIEAVQEMLVEASDEG